MFTDLGVEGPQGPIGPQGPSGTPGTPFVVQTFTMTPGVTDTSIAVITNQTPAATVTFFGQITVLAVGGSPVAYVTPTINTVDETDFESRHDVAITTYVSIPISGQIDLADGDDLALRVRRVGAGSLTIQSGSIQYVIQS